MKIFRKLFAMHEHYYGVPHQRESDSRLVQVCYECGAERFVKAALKIEARGQ